MFQIRVLGSAEVSVGERIVGLRDFGGAKPREVLCVLAVNSGRLVSKETLAAALWEHNPPPSWLSTLEGYVSLLRKALQPGGRPRESVVLTQRGCYLLDSERVQVDVKQFDELVLTADALGDAAAQPVLRAALRLARGDLLESERGGVWLERARVRHRERVRRAAIRAARLALASTDFDEALLLAERICDTDQLCEDAWRIAIEAHWRAGRRTDALRALEQLRGHLRSELGISTSAATERLHLDILRDERAVAVA